MEKTNINLEILNSIKKDDLETFSSLIADKTDLCFGRFPILTILYLYNAKKIIKKYKNQLENITNFNMVSEITEIYLQFKKVAKRCLRLYLNNSIVTPVEMLAIMQRNNEVKKMFLLTTFNETILNNLQAIYKIHYQSISVSNNVIKFSKKPISSYEIRLHKFGIIFSLCFVFVFSLFYIISGLKLGFGFNASSFNLYSQSQFIKALNSNGNYSLQEDISISSPLNNLNFNGTLNGNNKTIYLDTLQNDYFINQNIGVIKNLNIVYKNLTKQISSNLSLFTKSNLGRLENVNIICENLNLICEKINTNIDINAFSNNNSGTIENCSLLLNCNITSGNNTNSIFSGFVGKNSGTILNCEYKTSKVVTFETDISGFVNENEITGQIVNCKNYATFEQSSSQKGWSPTVAGISLVNLGTIKNCFNFAHLKVISLAEESSSSTLVFLGGITAKNYSLIEKCLNKGNLTANSKKITIYLGGVSAYSQYFKQDEKNIIDSVIKCCGVDCNINVSSEDENALVFAGGIGGFYYGEVTDSFSLAKFVNKPEENKYLVGSFIGSLLAGRDIFGYNFYFFGSNNYSFQDENAPLQIGGLRVVDGSVLKCGENILNNNKVKIDTEENIKLSEVYWNE